LASACGRTALTGQPLAQPIPHAVDVRFADCLVCHVADQLSAKAPFDHVALKYTNKDCSSLPVCHALPKGTSTTPPTSTTPSTTKPSTTTPGTTTPGSTTPGSTTPGTTTPSAKVLGSVALKLEPTFHPAAYDTVCMLCHAEGVGVQQYPMAPTWPGTPKSPGPWTVEKGSPADHTGRTDVATCTKQAGCHTK
jgi:hypothetical protein